MNADPHSFGQLEREIADFVRDVTSKKEWDIIVPIMRKGFFLLMSMSNDHQEKILLPPFHDVTNLREKTILIIDDKAWHGHTMEKTFKEIMERGAQPENVKTAVFIKHASCNFPIDYYQYELSDREYEKKEAEFSEYYDSSCLQLDPDHLVAVGNVVSQSLDPQDLRRFPLAVENAQHLGLFYLKEPKTNLCGIMKFAIADIPLSMIGLGDLSQILREEGVQKLRFCLEPNGKLFLVPIFCPEIQVDVRICKKALRNETKLCEQVSMDAPLTSEFCRDCLNFNLQIKALESLLPILRLKLRKAGFIIKIERLSWPELEYKFHEIRSILGNTRKRIQEADDRL